MGSRQGATPLVSVLLPCWNAEGSITRALDSVLEERSVDLECIVVDDGSTDRTMELVAAVARRDERVVVVGLPENAGVSIARNQGLERVRGQWLTLLDADDRFLPGGLGTLVRATRTPGIRAVIAQQVWSDGRRTWRSSLYDVPDIRQPGRKSIAANPGLVYYVSPHAKLFHRSCFADLWFSGRVLGDQPWIIRALIRAGGDVAVLGETVYEWYNPPVGGGPPSITSTARASAERGVEAAGVAIGAFAAVTQEAAQHLDDPESDALLARYAERLLRSDLGVHLSLALARRDPATAELIEALRAFIAGLPGRYLAVSDALARDILEPPLRRWSGLDEAGRSAYSRLLETALAADPGAIGRRPFIARQGLAAGIRSRGGLGHTVAALLLTFQWLAEGLRRRLRRRLAS